MAATAKVPAARWQLRGGGEQIHMDAACTSRRAGRGWGAKRGCKTGGAKGLPCREPASAQQQGPPATTDLGAAADVISGGAFLTTSQVGYLLSSHIKPARPFCIPPTIMANEHSAACEASQLHFLYRQFAVTPPAASPLAIQLQGQTGIVTGSNVGLGLEASRQLLGLGLSHLILAVRDEKKGAAARDDLAKGAPGANIEVWKLDMSSYDSVTGFAQRCSTLSRLDFVILNAGVFKMKLEINQSTGHDEVVQVNYLSTALLTILLLPVLAEKKEKTPKPSRIVIVSSETAAWCSFKEQDSDPILSAFNKPKFFDMQDRYYTSKLLQELLLVKLAKFVPSSVAVVNAVNPGFCYGSSLHRDATGAIGTVFSSFKRAIGRPTSIGARTLVDAAVVQGIESHGKYLGDCQIKPLVFPSQSRSFSVFLAN